MAIPCEVCGKPINFEGRETRLVIGDRDLCYKCWSENEFHPRCVSCQYHPTLTTRAPHDTLIFVLSLAIWAILVAGVNSMWGNMPGFIAFVIGLFTVPFLLHSYDRDWYHCPKCRTRFKRVLARPCKSR